MVHEILIKNRLIDPQVYLRNKEERKLVFKLITNIIGWVMLVS